MHIYKQECDFDDYNGILEKAVCLFCIPRSGSNYLADEIAKTGKLGYPLEYFSLENIKKLKLRLADFSINNISPLFQKRTSPNGVFSFKWNSNFGPIKNLKLKPDYNIFIDRKDKEAQAKSFCIAEKTGEWLVKKTFDYVPSNVSIFDATRRLAEMRESTLKMIPGEYLEVYYEDFIDNPGKTITTILDYVLGETDSI